MKAGRHSSQSFSIAVALCLFSLIVADAQTTLYVLVEGDGRVDCGAPCQRQPALWEIDVENARIRSQILLSSSYHTHHGLTATPDGRYLVWIGSDALASPSAETLNVFDRQTRTSTEVLRQPVQTPVSSAWSPVLAHPTRVRIFTQFLSAPPIAIDQSGTMPLTSSLFQPVMENLTANGGAITIKKYGGAVLLDSETGAVIREMAVDQDTWAVNRDGTELYSARATQAREGHRSGTSRRARTDEGVLQ